MTSAVADRAFEAYFTTHLDQQGNGLGLAQVYRTAIKAGGTASINSVEGEGTAIQLRLPALVSDPEKAPAEMPTPEA